MLFGFTLNWQNGVCAQSDNYYDFNSIVKNLQVLVALIQNGCLQLGNCFASERFKYLEAGFKWDGAAHLNTKVHQVITCECHK